MLDNQVAICIARYCAVFPISKVINLVYKARGQRADELPHSYQMMLFWAGLRGAVGVALAAGMKGENAIALRTTVLVSVVLTVVVFGGTIGRMIEILGIRTGVDDDDDESSDEEGYQMGGGEPDVEARTRSKSKRRGSGKMVPMDVDGTTVSPGDTPYRDRDRLPRPSSRARQLSAALRPAATFSIPHGSESSEDSDPDVLPAVGDAPVAEKEGDLTRVWRDGQWFTVLDERYLLPVFSNATASRLHSSKKALLRAKRNSFALDRGDESFETDAASSASAPGSPYLNSAGSKSHKEFSGSFSDILSSLVSVGPSTPAMPHPYKRDDDDAHGAGSTIDLNLTSLGHDARPGVRPRASMTGTSVGSIGIGSPQLGAGGGPVLAFGAPTGAGSRRPSGSPGSVTGGGSRSNVGSDGSSGTSSAGGGRRG